MIRRPPRSTQSRSSAASDVYKRQVGHMRVVPDGHACGCGHDGCWEQYASGRALVREAKAALVNDPIRAVRLLELAGGDPNHLKGPQVTKAAREGDPLALELLTTLGLSLIHISEPTRL